MSPAEPLLIGALSGRALAQSAREAGSRPVVLDRFADLDTRAAAQAVAVVCHRGDRPRSRASALLRGGGAVGAAPCPWSGAAGSTASPGLSADLAHGRELLGNRPELLRRVTDPVAFAETCSRSACPPGGSPTGPRRIPGVAGKQRGASGGWHVRRRRGVTRARARRLSAAAGAGTRVSVLLLGDGRRCTALALSEQWQAGRPHRFTGVLCRPRPREAGDSPARRGRRGGGGPRRRLASADLLLDEDGGFHCSRSTPRPGASLEAARSFS